MKFTKLSMAALVCMASSSAFAAQDIAGAFKEAKVNGTVRFNSFLWEWDERNDKGNNAEKDSLITAVGGSLLVKTSPLYGVSAMAGFYTSNPIHAFNSNEQFAKSGGDLDLRSSTNTAINTIGQAYLQYDIAKTTVQVGRLIYDTPLTSANDSKMVPNTFEAATVVSKDIQGTTLTAAYINRFKPRNEDTFIGLLANTPDTNTLMQEQKSGKQTKGLIVLGAINESIKGLKLEAWDYSLPDYVNTLILEANYKMPVGKGSMTFGARYLKQMDRYSGNADIASFNVLDAAAGGYAKNAAVGYKDGKNLDSDLYMARAIYERGEYKAQLGYSQVADKADIVAPWRGFPTGGYTRPMKIENWDANIRSWMAAFWYDFGKAGLVNGLDFNINYLVDNRDEKKLQPKGDMTTVTADLNYKFSGALKGFDGRLRYGYHNDKGNEQWRLLRKKEMGWDFSEYRAELTYRF